MKRNHPRIPRSRFDVFHMVVMASIILLNCVIWGAFIVGGWNVFSHWDEFMDKAHISYTLSFGKGQ